LFIRLLLYDERQVYSVMMSAFMSP